MGVPIDRGLTRYKLRIPLCDFLMVEMGVPIDRGLTQSCHTNTNRDLLVEMGVPIDRGLTHCTNNSH